MAATPRIIDYADNATDSGVSCTATAGGCEITLPVSLRQRGRTTLLGEFAAELAVFGSGAVCLAFFHSAWMGIGSLVALLSIVVVLFAIDERRRSRRPRASITLTENALEIVIPGEPGTGDFLWSAPRTRVYEVKLVPHSGNVVIRARGHEMFDLRLHDSPAVSTWIVQTLRCHLGLEEP